MQHGTHIHLGYLPLEKLEVERGTVEADAGVYAFVSVCVYVFVCVCVCVCVCVRVN